MNINIRLKDIFLRPPMFGVSSSEDVFWHILGYNICTRYKVEIDWINSFNNFILNEHGLSTISTPRNWGLIIRCHSSSDIESIQSAQTLFEKFENIKYANTNQYYTQQVEAVLKNTKSFREIIQYTSNKKIFDTTIQLRSFLEGYETGMIDSKMQDQTYEKYKNFKTELNAKVLTELEIPTYFNALTILYARHYPISYNGVEEYLSRVLELV